MSETAGLSAKHEQRCSGSHNEPECITTELHLIIHSRGGGGGSYQESLYVTDSKILTKANEG